MQNNQVKRNSRVRERRLRSAFSIQLLECAVVAVLFALSFVLAGKLIYNNAFPFGWIDGFLLYLMMSAFAIIVLGANRYFSFISRPFPETAAKVIGLVVILNFIFIALLYFSRNIRLSPYYFIVADTFQILSLILIKRFSALLKGGILRNRVSLVIGIEQEKNELVRELRKQGAGRLAYISANDEKLKDYLDKADNIYLAGILSKKMKDRIISYCVLKDKKVYIVPETYEIAMRKSEMTQVGDIPLFAVESFRLSESQNIIKRMVDILLSVVGILLTSPVMLLAAIKIKLEDGGPVFYRQERSGLNGREFKVIKFRSMVVDAEKYTGAVFAAENDPRITRAGRFMRAARIDELPQFFNVLAGSMSIIGPRPERPQFVQTFSEVLPEYSSRLAVKPGITGLAQVMGNYTTSAENKVKFDLVYIRDYSLLLDIKILFRTIKVIFTKSRSEGFAAKEAEAAGGLSAEFAAELAFGGNQPGAAVGRPYRSHRFGKAVLVFCCSLVIIFGCTILRYSALTTAMLEAAAMPVSAQTTEQQVSGEITAPASLGIAGRTGTEPEPADNSEGTNPDGTPASTSAPSNSASVADSPAGSTAANMTGSSGIAGESGSTGALGTAGTGTIAGTNSPGAPAASIAASNTTGKGQTGQALLAGPAVAGTVQPDAESTAQSGAGSQGKVVLTQDKINKAISKMSISEKLSISFDLIARLSAKDLMVLDKLAEGGFTAEEKKSAKELMYRYYDNAEVEYIKEIYWEYVK
jgi:exopolysaccharide biosynthesis polyprenyl glycosylphosphotransferase